MRKFYLLPIVLLAACGSPNKTVITATPVKAVFDVPALKGQSIDQIKKALGKPGDKPDEPSTLQMKQHVSEWENQFQHDSTMLLVTYNPQTRKVIDFFVSTNHGKTADYKPLLALVNVPGSTLEFSIEPRTMIANTELFTGVKLTEK